MNVLVWRSNHVTHALVVETPLQFLRLYERMKLVMSDWHLDGVLQDLFKAMGECTTRSDCQRLFERFVHEHCDGYRAFEQFEFVQPMEL